MGLWLSGAGVSSLREAKKLILALLVLLYPVGSPLKELSLAL